MSATGLIFAIAFLAGCALAMSRHPVYGAMTYIATLFLSPPLRWWGQGLLLPVRWSLIAAGVTFVAILVHARRDVGAPTSRLRHPIIPLFVVLIAWLYVESLWSLDQPSQSEFISYYVKFLLAIWLVYRSADSADSVRLIMWTYALGCFYFGWIAYTSYEGGRFEDFGGSGIDEANAGALTLVIGTFMIASLFLASDNARKGVLIVVAAFVLNGMVTTISRSAFLAVVIGGLVYIWFSPVKYAARIRVLSVLAVVMFTMLTGPSYWARVQSLKQAGQDVEGVDTGSGRIVLVQAQLRMWEKHPLGCGANCTVVLSPNYLDEKHLDRGARASHNTYMTMLVEHGLPGIFLYLFMLLWVMRTLLWLRRQLRGSDSFIAMALPGLAAALAANFFGDLFVPYSKYEIRFWLVALLMTFADLAAREIEARAHGTSTREGMAAPGRPPPHLPASR